MRIIFSFIHLIYVIKSFNQSLRAKIQHLHIFLDEIIFRKIYQKNLMCIYTECFIKADEVPHLGKEWS